MHPKLIILDLDGVLVDARDLHYESLNRALEIVDSKYVIERQEHLSKYDGLNTSKKLDILVKEKGFPETCRALVWEEKQRQTWQLIDKMQPDTSMKLTLRKLKEEGYTIAVASNSVRHTVKLMLVKRGLMEYVDFFYANDDVKHPKPATEMYLKCMIKAGVSPKETLILEDSIHGRRAALATGAFLMGVKNTSDVTYDNIKSMIGSIQTHYEVGKEKWSDKRMNILIPLAGKGSRFSDAGFVFPKPLIEVRNGEPMIQMVVNNLNIDAHYIFICQKEHEEKYNLTTLLHLIAPGSDVIVIDGITEGAACTALTAKHLIDSDRPLLIANSDQFLVWDSTDFMYSMIGDSVDAGLITHHSVHPKWSFAKVDDSGWVTEVREKSPISNHASVGLYYYSQGKDFVHYAEQMIEKDLRVLGEFYICPVLQGMIDDGKRVKNYHIDEFYGTGTPEDLQYFTQNYKPCI